MGSLSMQLGATACGPTTACLIVRGVSCVRSCEVIQSRARLSLALVSNQAIAVGDEVPVSWYSHRALSARLWAGDSMLTIVPFS